jgi:hypothetical protein
MGEGMAGPVSHNGNGHRHLRLIPGNNGQEADPEASSCRASCSSGCLLVILLAIAITVTLIILAHHHVI